ncbi:MAG: discoidin domain-containing protein, partial [Gemmatimonadetes bacterium]|nr:discoidin domain-containing protein [Gemmatimonadota bacterium]
AHAKVAPPTEAVGDLALNPTGRGFPEVSASFTGASDSAAQAVDGRIAFTRYSRDRWTAYGSPHAEDWLAVDFGAPRRVGRVELYLYGDGGGIAAPAAFRVEVWDGDGWHPAAERARDPTRPTAWAVNTVLLQPVQASRVRVVFTHALPAVTGVTEMRVFGPDQDGPA